MPNRSHFKHGTRCPGLTTDPRIITGVLGSHPRFAVPRPFGTKNSRSTSRKPLIRPNRSQRSPHWLSMSIAENRDPGAQLLDVLTRDSEQVEHHADDDGGENPLGEFRGTSVFPREGIAFHSHHGRLLSKNRSGVVMDNQKSVVEVVGEQAEASGVKTGQVFGLKAIKRKPLPKSTMFQGAHTEADTGMWSFRHDGSQHSRRPGLETVSESANRCSKCTRFSSPGMSAVKW